MKNGADEIDMVVNLAMVKDAAWSSVSGGHQGRARRLRRGRS